jgi:molybdopterin-containing oxidoreductase family membrane subunit
MSDNGKKQMLGVFPDEEKAVSAIEALKPLSWELDRVHSPFPSHRILEALKLKKSRVGYFTLAGGILGFLFGLALAIFTALRWGLIVSGKPIVSMLPFFIVGFEFTILFSVLGNVIGLLILTRLPRYQDLEKYDPRFSSDHFGIVASCEEGEQERLTDFFRTHGGEASTLD